MNIQNIYKKEKLQPPYDVIIIGSGIGGLTLASLLSEQGKKVLVLERHYVAGGFTHTFRRKGYEWDVGIHYIGEVHRKNSMLRKIFDHLSEGYLDWADMGEVYDRIVIGQDVYDYVVGEKNLMQHLKTCFPEEGEAIDTYFQLIKMVKKSSKDFFMEKVLPSWLPKFIKNKYRNNFTKYSKQTTHQVLSQLTGNQKLIGLLSAQYGDYGLPPKQGSFAVHAMVMEHYLNGGAYPVGGSSQIAETFIAKINKQGGQVLVSADVDQLIVKNNKVLGVRMKNGDEIFAKQVVSTTGVKNTLHHLLPQSLRSGTWFEKLNKIESSVAHLCVYLGLKGSVEENQLPKCNYWIYPSADHDASVNDFIVDANKPLPVVYASFPASKDPAWQKAHPDKSTMELITLAPYAWFKKWEETKWNKRPEDYEQFKKAMAERMLQVIEKFFPHLREKIAVMEISTPLSTQHFCNYGEGEIYGLAHTPERFAETALRPQTPIKNFYLSGQDVVTDGIGGALFSGILTASAMLKKNVLKNILRSRGTLHVPVIGGHVQRAPTKN